MSSYIKIDNGAKRLDNQYQVGDIIETRDNINPSDRLGGTWEWYDTRMTYIYVPSVDCFQANSSNCTVSSGSCVGSDHNLFFSLTFVNNVTLNDTAVELGTIDYSQLGISTTYYQVCVSTTDAGNAVLMNTINDSGVVSVVDVVGKNSATSVSSGNSCNISTNIAVSPYQIDKDRDDTIISWIKTA